MIHKSIWWWLNQTFPIDSDAANFFTLASINDTPTKNAVNMLISGIKIQGLWTGTKELKIYAGGNAAAHKWNIKDQRDLDAAYRSTFTGATHDANGVTFNATSGFEDTKLNPGTVFGSNPMSVHVYYRRWSTGRGFGNDGPVMDNSLAGNVQLGGGSHSDIHPQFTNGMISLTRQGSNIVKVYNGQSSGNLADPFSTYSTGNLRFGAYSFGGFSDCNIAFHMVTDAFTVAQCQALHTLVKAYQFAMGRNLLTEYFFGDSYTEEIVNNLNGWPTGFCTNKHLIEVNYGVGGTEIGAMDPSLFPGYTTGYDGRVWISYGLNEAGHNGQTPSALAATLQTKVNALLAKNVPAAKLVINCGYFANAATWASYGAGANDARYQAIITAYQGVATTNGTQFVNPFAVTDATDIAADNVHYKASGVTKAIAYYAAQLP